MIINHHQNIPRVRLDQQTRSKHDKQWKHSYQYWILRTEQTRRTLQSSIQSLSRDFLFYWRDEQFMMVRNHHQHHLMRLSHHVSVPLVNCMELQLRFLCPQDLEQVKLLCRDWFPIEYPDTWYQEITSNPRFFSLAATLSGSIIGLIVAETKELNQLAKEDRSLLASCFLSNTKVKLNIKLNHDL